MRLTSFAGCAVLLASCGGATPLSTAPSIRPSAPPATPPASIGVTPPASLGVPSGYAAAKLQAMSVGRRAVQMTIGQDVVGLRQQFTKRLRTAVSQAALAKQLAKLGPVLKRATFRSDSAVAGLYTAKYKVSGKRLAVTAGIDQVGRLSMLKLKRVLKLPPDPMSKYVATARFRLPLEGTWWVFWGGKTASQNYHVAVPDQRHAYDIVVWRNGATHRGDGTRNEDYWAFGKKVLAPAAGLVISAVDGIRDNKPKLERNRTEIAGNHVLLKVGDAEYLVLGHFKRGTVRVKVGERVNRGDVLGLCGNSGNSTEPHLHIHLQNTPTLFKSTGLPLAFDNYDADGKHVKTGSPVQGEFVTSLP